MAWFCAAAVAVAAWISAAAAAVAASVAALVAAIAAVVVTIAVTVASYVAGFVLGVGEAIGFITYQTVITSLEAVHLLNATAVTTALAVADFVIAIGAVWQAFAQAIHLKTLLAVHEVVYFLSANYRDLMAGFYRQVADLSAALQLGASFLPLAIRNARTLVLDASSAMGRSYDIAEVGWLYNLVDFSRYLGIYSAQLEANPERIFNVLDWMIIKPAVNAKASSVQLVFTTIDNLVELGKKTVDTAVLLRDDVDRLVSDLPEKIRSEIQPELDRILDPFDDWVSDQYGPAIAGIAGVIDILGVRLTGTQKVAGDLINRLKHPGDILVGIDRLWDLEREHQEELIYDAGSRIPRRFGEAIETETLSEYAMLESLADALELKLPMAASLPKEGSIPRYPASFQTADTRSWFVGDY